MEGTDEYKVLKSKFAAASVAYDKLIQRRGGPDELGKLQKIYGQAVIRAGVAAGRRMLKPLARLAGKKGAKKIGQAALRAAGSADRGMRVASLAGRKAARSVLPKKVYRTARHLKPVAGELAVYGAVGAAGRKAKRKLGVDKLLKEIDMLKGQVEETARKKAKRKKKPFIRGWRFPE